ncbi:MAG: ABC transporter substrate-binding protein [Desulforhopalus sp.]
MTLYAKFVIVMLQRTVYPVLVLLLLVLTQPCSAAGTSSAIVDSSGNSIQVSRPFTRIISLYSAHTENICRLGGLSQLVGISRSDDFPPSVLDKPRFSYREDPEKFIAANPDLVLVRPMIERSYPQFIKKLRQAGITVISLQPNSIDEMFDYWRTLGVLTGREKEAKEMIADFQDALSAYARRLADKPWDRRPKVYFESIHTKMKTFAPESIGTFVLEQAGGINIAADASQVRSTNIAFYGKERLLSRGDEIDFFLAQHGRMNPVTEDTITQEPGFGAIKAIRENKVYLIDEALVSRPTFRILEGIEQLYAIFYPGNNTQRQEP